MSDGILDSTDDSVDPSVDAGSSSDTSSSTQASPATAESTAQPTGTSSVAEAVTATPTESGTDQAAQAPETEAITPEAFAALKKQYAGSTRSWQESQARAKQLEQELQQLKSQFQPFQGIDRNALQQFQQSQGVPMWDSTHKQHAEFNELRKTAENYNRLISNANEPATRDWLISQMREELGESGIKTLQEWKRDVQKQQYELQTNPREFYRKLIQAEAQPVIQKSLSDVSTTYQETEKAKAQVQGWLKDNQDAATPENLKAIMEKMDQGMQFDAAAALVERDYWKSQISNANNAKSSAEEKQRLLEGKAASGMARNPLTSKKVDVQQFWKEKKLQGTQKIDALFELDAQKRL